MVFGVVWCVVDVPQLTGPHLTCSDRLNLKRELANGNWHMVDRPVCTVAQDMDLNVWSGSQTRQRLSVECLAKEPTLVWHPAREEVADG